MYTSCVPLTTSMVTKLNRKPYKSGMAAALNASYILTRHVFAAAVRQSLNIMGHWQIVGRGE